MFLYTGIVILILLLALINWKRTVLLWLPLSLLFNPCVCLKYNPPALTVTLAVNLILTGLYFIREKKKRNIMWNGDFLFKKSCKMYLWSYGLSIIFSIVPVMTVFMNTVQYFMNTFMIVFLFNKALNSYDDIKLFIKIAIIVFIPIIGLGLFESVTHDNPWLDFVYLNCPDAEFVEGKMYYTPPFLTPSNDVQTRFGMVRSYSFFDIHIAFGCACVIYLFLFLYFNRFGRLQSISSYYFIIIIFLCLVGVLLCNSKTPFVGLPFIIIAAIPIRYFFQGKGVLILFFFLIVVLIALSYNNSLFENFYALFDSQKMEEGGGSTAQMRVEQYKAGIDLFMQNPLFGNGIGSLSYILKSTSKYAEIRGSESSWLKVLPQQGIVGLFAYLALYKDMFLHLDKFSGRRTAFGFCTGLMAMETATGFMTFSVYAPIVITVVRYNQLKKIKQYA